MSLDLRKLLAEYQDRVYNQAYRMLGNQEDAEEATQDVFLLIHRSGDEFRGESKVSTWIYRITANVCIDRLRRKQLPTSSLDREFEPDGDTLADVIPDDCPDPATLYEDEQMKEFVRSEVRSLPPKWAMAVSMYHFEDLSYEEISEAMGIPKATVATYILRGRQRLASRLVESTGRARARI
jgi:RNA polymerase sigma-70 factor (ECF subfamily)